MLLKIVREGLEQAITFDKLTGQVPISRTVDVQQSIDRTALPMVLCRLVIICLLALMASVSSHAEQRALHAYQCKENGVTTFSDEPCGRNERRVFLGYSSPQASVSANSASAPPARDNQRTNAFIDRLEIKRAIGRAEGRISDLQKERNIEIARLRARLSGQADMTGEVTATDQTPQPDALWDIAAEMANDTMKERIEEQMQVINTRYAEDIALEEQRLEQLRARLATMEDKPIQR